MSDHVAPGHGFMPGPDGALDPRQPPLTAHSPALGRLRVWAAAVSHVVERPRSPWAAVMLALAGAGVVGWETAANPSAVPSPPGFAVALRVMIILGLTFLGVYAQRSPTQASMGRLLTLAGLFSCLWLLNGSTEPVLFAAGVLCTSVVPTMLAYIMLAHHTDRPSTRRARRVMAGLGGGLCAAWLIGVFAGRQPPIRTPLLSCLPHCPSSPLALTSAQQAPLVIRAVIVVLWISLAWVTAIVLTRRIRGSSPILARTLAPIWVVAWAIALLLTAFFIASATGSGPVAALGAGYIATAVAVPTALFIGLLLERLYVGDALAQVITQLARRPRDDPRGIVGAALGDPSLQIAFRGSGLTSADGVEVEAAGESTNRAVSWINLDDRRVGAVIYDRELVDQASFVEAAGAAALIRLEEAQLEAELKASAKQLEESRVRLVESAHAERRRLERDLHDGVQQQLVGLRIKLDVAAEAVRQEPADGQRLLTSVADQMDDVLQSVRSLARGIYPTLLHRHGLPAALSSAARSAPIPVTVRASKIGRFREEVEIAVYFSCLEALQNVAKHAGGDVRALVILRQDGPRFSFEVRDSGVGFDLERVHRGKGFVNMRDRLEAVGGTFKVESAPGRGTSVRGTVPIA